MDIEYQVGTAGKLRLYMLEWGRIVRRGWCTAQLLEAGKSEAVGERLGQFQVAEVWERVVVEIPEAGFVVISED